MKLGSFALSIPEGRELGNGYVVMQHGTPYRVQVTNNGSRKCDAVLSIDGEEIGTYRLHAGQNWAIEHPPESQQRFTFYASGTTEAAQVGEHAVERQDKGLVQVTFYPEKEKEPEYDVLETLGGTRSFGMTRGGGMYGGETRGAKGLGSGLTGLSGYSGAQYGKAGEIDRDETEAVTITLRLVTEDDTPQPLTRRRALSNQVPPAV